MCLCKIWTSRTRNAWPRMDYPPGCDTSHPGGLRLEGKLEGQIFNPQIERADRGLHVDRNRWQGRVGTTERAGQGTLHLLKIFLGPRYGAQLGSSKWTWESYDWVLYRWKHSLKSLPKVFWKRITIYILLIQRLGHKKMQRRECPRKEFGNKAPLDKADPNDPYGPSLGEWDRVIGP